MITVLPRLGHALIGEVEQKLCSRHSATVRTCPYKWGSLEHPDLKMSALAQFSNLPDGVRRVCGGVGGC